MTFVGPRRRDQTDTHIYMHTQIHLARLPHVLDALDGGGAHVGGELLVAEDGEALLERELEPVLARHAVARPVCGRG